MEASAIKSTEELIQRGILDKDGNVLAPMPLNKSTLKTWGICITLVYRPGEKDECSFVTLNPDDRIVIKWIDADGVKYETCLFFFPGFWK